MNLLSPLPTPKGQRFRQQLCELLKSRLNDATTSLDDLCNQLAVSRAQLNRKARACTGMTAMQLLKTYRLEHALQRLVQTEDSIAEIAWTCGFEDPNYFCRVFKDAYGMSPRAYRDQVWQHAMMADIADDHTTGASGSARRA
ncbi:MAG: hypothetical protein OHK0039_19470 [Bacteroidia bacterium]